METNSNLEEAVVLESEWDNRFMRTALDVASWSKDPKRKVGAVLVSPDRRHISYGYNGFPRGIKDLRVRLNDDKARLALTVHAELNAIHNAGFATNGGTMYCTSFPCHECAKSIIQARVLRVVAPSVLHERGSKWFESWQLAGDLMTEAGLRISFHGERSCD